MGWFGGGSGGGGGSAVYEQTILFSINNDSLIWAVFMLDQLGLIGEAFNNISMADIDELLSVGTVEELVNSSEAMSAVVKNENILRALYFYDTARRLLFTSETALLSIVESSLALSMIIANDHFVEDLFNYPNSVILLLENEFGFDTLVADLRTAERILLSNDVREGILSRDSLRHRWFNSTPAMRAFQHVSSTPVWNSITSNSLYRSELFSSFSGMSGVGTSSHIVNNIIHTVSLRNEIVSSANFRGLEGLASEPVARNSMRTQQVMINSLNTAGTLSQYRPGVSVMSGVHNIGFCWVTNAGRVSAHTGTTTVTGLLSGNQTVPFTITNLNDFAFNPGFSSSQINPEFFLNARILN